MLRVTVEILPGGNVERARQIAELDIWNESDLASISDYGYEISGDEITTRRGDVRGHRRADGWEPLVRRALAACAVSSDRPAHGAGDDATRETPSNVGVTLAAMVNRPSPDMLEGWLKLADDIDRNGGEDPVDVDRLVEQSAIAARGLRRLVEYVRATTEGLPSARDR